MLAPRIAHFNVINLAGGTETVSISYAIGRDEVDTLFTLADCLEMHIRLGTNIVNVTSTCTRTLVYLEEAADDWFTRPYLHPLDKESREREWGALRERWVTDDILESLSNSRGGSEDHGKGPSPVLTIYDSDSPPARTRIPASNGRSLLETFTRVLQRLLGHKIRVESLVYNPEVAQIVIMSKAGEDRSMGWTEALAPFMGADTTA
ncbi:hypothetical protein CC1G_10012 [Coprinopsis cinerea okayama7|uniref:Uncharacterized protein n=1 Tax=Coprinopsis cinerea (strain Okayama-7 / 130 / ATCC MYA-4618 / FGSC 9003) TaxID=240176 RepID=A8NDL0_COPC7|nr:hypothetical protein CC1G_10012 [Coprinopsis cinerea okayama7\|eukprot:XP_001832798.2 hypothetical protein CC1G_10012 [Coprinopsis cinerea okayama7\